MTVARGLASRLRLKRLRQGHEKDRRVVARGLASRLRLKLRIDLALRGRGIGR